MYRKVQLFLQTDRPYPASTQLKKQAFQYLRNPPYASYSHATTPRATTLLISFFFFLPHLKA